jgi:hypothetical protein
MGTGDQFPGQGKAREGAAFQDFKQMPDELNKNAGSDDKELPTSREVDRSGPRVWRGGQPIKPKPLSRFRALFIYSFPKAILMRLD